MSDDIERTGGGPAPDGVTEGDDTPGGADVASALKIDAPAAHPGDDIIGPEEEDAPEAPEPSALPENEVLRDLIGGFEAAEWHLSHGQDVVTVPNDQFAEFATAAKDAGFEVCVDVTAVDWFRKRKPRYDVVANLLSHQHRLRLRIMAGVDRETPTIPSITPVWPGAGFAEREVYDMFGIEFEGHPDLTRILMPDEWEGHPLRKDFAVGSVPVQFKDSHKVT